MASTLNRRLELHAILSNICENCEFEPPTGLQLTYPCITYHRVNNLTEHADNIPYKIATRYTVTVIDTDPDSEIVPKIEQLSGCTYDTHFENDGLIHDVFTLYY